jgi:hypothetical protein
MLTACFSHVICVFLARNQFETLLETAKLSDLQVPVAANASRAPNHGGESAASQHFGAETFE